MLPKLLRLALLAVVGVASSGLLVSAQTPAGTSICDYYTSALNGGAAGNTAANQATLVTNLVTRSVVGESTSTPLVTGIINIEAMKPFFNSTINYRTTGTPNAGAGPAPNFYTNTAEFNALAGKLVAFFGVALGCTKQGTTGFPAYTGSTDMTGIHKSMPITAAVFSKFNEQIALSAQSYGVGTADLTTVGGLLASFNRGAFNADGTPVADPGTNYAMNIICNDPSTCPCAKAGYDAANGCKPNSSGAASTVQAVTFATILAVAAGLFVRA